MKLQKDIDSLIKILISILLIGEIVFVKNKSSNNDAVQIKNPEIVNNGKLKQSLYESFSPPILNFFL